MFRLHTGNAARLGYERGWVGPPYRVFKITKENVVELPSAEKVAKSEPPPAVAETNSADEKAIDSVMERLEKTFLAGDYSYVFEIMYAPIVEQMGGKEKGVEAAKGIVEQMKKQQIVMLSWKAKKPYQYVTGSSRSYAIIPYESAITVAGKKLKVESYQLGIKDAGSQWQFVNGDNLSPEIFANFFPDFPKTFELPKLRRFYE